MMMNAARGEVALEIVGRRYCLCLTLGALAEIETALGATSLGDLEARLQNLTARQLIDIVHALLRGGGETISRDELAQQPLNMTAMGAAVSRAFSAAGTSIDAA